MQPAGAKTTQKTTQNHKAQWPLTTFATKGNHEFIFRI
jgi:hypothetical protein